MTKTILITGAGSGFGKGAAIELASRGHRVFATTETAAQADELGAAHPELTAMKLDITDAADVAKVGEIDPDVLINNAGFGVMAPLSNVPLDRLKAGFEVNVFGMVAMSQAAIPGMKAKGAGRIINMSSVAGVLSGPMTAPYAMTKHAVEAFTVALRQEVAAYGIDVTKLNPGPYDTGFNDAMVNGIAGYIDDGDAPAAEFEALVRSIVLTDQLDPNDVVQAMANLSEADETPVETFLPEGIKEMLAAHIN
ncbi:MAG: NAD(P)-dependent dehydrogenase (short-subunit alcohol dehydrogenase family) [Candidatus Poriferisodalaceae bacterium]|jgi:NAD(P)-dependent dehydrogenase (short-subunit alcohol dehydrogenase family)